MALLAGSSAAVLAEVAECPLGVRLAAAAEALQQALRVAANSALAVEQEPARVLELRVPWAQRLVLPLHCLASVLQAGPRQVAWLAEPAPPFELVAH